jgi:hypothetical protein
LYLKNGAHARVRACDRALKMEGSAAISFGQVQFGISDDTKAPKGLSLAAWEEASCSRHDESYCSIMKPTCTREGNRGQNGESSKRGWQRQRAAW